MRTGIYGGSFNPVHNGHIHLAEAAMKDFGLDRIFLVPSKISPHRSSAEYASGEDRLAMLELASEGRKGIEVSDYEIKSDRVSYTIYTVEHFRSLFPEDELYLLVGSDMLLCFEKWFRFEDILSQVTLCAVSRNSGDLDELRAAASRLSQYGCIRISEAPPVEISSSEIRKNIEKNTDCTCYLHKNVVQYIRSKGLYSVRGEGKMQYDPEDKKKYLKSCLSAKRYQHSMNVAEECRKPVYLCSRSGGMIPDPEQIITLVKNVEGGM